MRSRPSLAADKTRLGELEQAVRQYLAWKSIDDERESLNLDPFQASQAKKKLQHSEDTVSQRIPETYQWLLVPSQPESKGSVEWQEIRVQGQDLLAVRASKKLKTEELLIVQLSGTRLRLELDRVPLWRGDHVALKLLAEDFAQYLYLPRLRDADVLADSVRDGLKLMTWQQESFAYADGWDAGKGRYRGLRAGQLGSVTIEGESVLVKPEVAARQLETESAAATVPDLTVRAPGVTTPAGQPGGGTEAPTQGPAGPTPAASMPTRFHGSASLDPTRLGRDAGKIAEEVVQHLAGLVDAKLEVNLGNSCGNSRRHARQRCANCHRELPDPKIQDARVRGEVEG